MSRRRRRAVRPAAAAPGDPADGAAPAGGSVPAAPRFDWRGLMRAGLFGLELRPAEFWALTPVELLLMLGLDGGPPPLTRARLEALAARFPDGVKGQDDGGSGRHGGADCGAGNQSGGSAGDGGGV